MAGAGSAATSRSDVLLIVEDVAGDADAAVADRAADVLPGQRGRHRGGVAARDLDGHDARRLAGPGGAGHPVALLGDRRGHRGAEPEHPVADQLRAGRGEQVQAGAQAVHAGQVLDAGLVPPRAVGVPEVVVELPVDERGVLDALPPGRRHRQVVPQRGGDVAEADPVTGAQALIPVRGHEIRAQGADIHGQDADALDRVDQQPGPARPAEGGDLLDRRAEAVVAVDQADAHDAGPAGHHRGDVIGGEPVPAAVLDEPHPHAVALQRQERVHPVRELLLVDDDLVARAPVQPERDQADALAGVVQQGHVGRIAPDERADLGPDLGGAFPPVADSRAARAAHHPLQQVPLRGHVRHRQRPVGRGVEPDLLAGDRELLAAQPGDRLVR